MNLRAHILVVEDDPDIAELMRYNLQAHGLQVTIVSDGGPALRELEHGQYDLIVLDLMLPTVSGLEVCKAVRHDAHFAHLPVIIVSARGEDGIRQLALSLGANDYLAKPFQPSVLLERITALLQGPADPLESGAPKTPSESVA